jgi:hypothetical protein
VLTEAAGMPSMSQYVCMYPRVISWTFRRCRFPWDRNKTAGPHVHPRGELAAGSGRPVRSERHHGERDSNGNVQRQDCIKQVRILVITQFWLTLTRCMMRVANERVVFCSKSSGC